MVLKKNYTTIDTKTLKIQELCPQNNTLYPQILVFRDRWAAVTGDTVMLFEASGKPITSGAIDVEAASKISPIYALAVQNYYLLALRDSGVTVYNLLDFSRIQEIEMEKGWMFHDIVIDEGNVLIAQDMPTTVKREFTTTLLYLKAVPYSDQIRQLLEGANVDSAFRVFEQNTAKTAANYEAKKERFNLEAAWALFRNFQFDKAVEYFLQVNYDPRELLTLAGILPKKGKLLRDLVEEKKGSAPGPEKTMGEGTRAIVRLIEEKRRYVEGKFADSQKAVSFLLPEKPVNPLDVPKSCPASEIMCLLNSSLMKLYVEQKDVKLLHEFISNTKNLTYSKDEIDSYLSARQEKDRSYTTKVCQALLADHNCDYINALEIWKTLGQATREIRDMACKETARLLKTQVKEKETLFRYARMVVVFSADDALKIFTEGEHVSQLANEDDILRYFESLDAFNPELREKYLKYLLSRESPPERFFTQLGLLYAGRLKALLHEKDGPLQLERAVASQRQQNLDALNYFIAHYNNYDANAILQAIKGLGLYKEEIELYTRQKDFEAALGSFVCLGERDIDFSAAEKYCEDAKDPLYAILFGKVMDLYQEARAKLPKLRSGLELAEQKKRAAKLEGYCKKFLKRHATNEKMDAVAVVGLIPDDWFLKELRDGKEDDSLLQYVALTLNDRQDKDINMKINRHAKEMYKLDVEATQIKMQRAYVVIHPENVCKVCRKKLNGAKAFCVFPNGVVTHSSCSKSLNVCPVTKVNFAKKVYL